MGRAAPPPALRVGSACAPGRAAGRVHRWAPAPTAHGPGRPGDVAALDRAVEAVRARLPRARAVGPADQDLDALADVQRGLLSDPLLVGRAREAVAAGALPDDAVQQAVAAAVALLHGTGDPTLRARCEDVRVVGDRLRAALRGVLPPALPGWPVVLVARRLPADLLLALAVPRGQGPRPVRALLLEEGGPLAHTAILARQRGLPMVGGLGGLLDEVRDGDPVLVDGDRGEIVLHPDREALRRFHDRGPLRRDRPATELEAWANLDLPEESRAAREAGAAGVGLLRTDGMLHRDGTAPSVEVQARRYVHALAPWPAGVVVVRLFDRPPGTGPERPLGPRGIRALDHAPARLDAQLVALGRASARVPRTRLVVMAPMVTGPRELDRLVARIDAAWPADAPRPGLGAMVETPAAALDLGPLLERVEHVAVGTNDLLQLTLGASREDPAVAALLDPDHPALWRILDEIGESCRARGIRAVVCGALASEARHRPRLASAGFHGVGLGLADLRLRARSPGRPRG